MSGKLNITPHGPPAFLPASASQPGRPSTSAQDPADSQLHPDRVPTEPTVAPPTTAAAAAANVSATTADAILAAQPLMAFGPGGRRTRVTQACESCRKRKVKCSGPQPGILQTCRHCLEYRLECAWAIDLKNRVAPGGGGAKSKSKAAADSNGAKGGLVVQEQQQQQQLGDDNNGDDSQQRQRQARSSAAAAANPRSKTKSSRSASRQDKRQRQPDTDDSFADGTASDMTSSMSSTTAGSSTSLLADPRVAEPSKSRRVDVHSSASIQPSPSALSTLSNVRVATDHDVEELANHLTLVVSLDELGQTRGMSNYGTSTGLAALRDWSPTVAQGLFSVTPFTEPSLPTTALLRENQLFPSRLAATTFINVFFDSAGKWLTFASRRNALAQLDSPTPHFAFLYAVMAFGAFKLEMGYGLTVLNQPMLLSRVFSERAKRLLAPTMSAHVQTIESVQALMLLSCYSLNTPGTSAWGMSGLAIRMAFDMGLHLDFRAAPFREKVAPALIPMYTKTFAFMYAFDRHISVTLGRPMMLNEEECFLNLNELMRTPENLARYPPEVHDELVAPDEYFLWSIRLADLSGKLIRTLNCIQYHRQLPFTLPELHAMLSKYRIEVPPRLHFRASEPDLTLKTQSAALNLRFYGLVIAMYRPLITSSRSAQINAHLKRQYLSVMESALTASLEIVTSIMLHHTIYPYTQFNDVLNMINVCVLLLTHHNDLLDSSTAATQLTGNVLGYLDAIHDLILHVAPSWPIMAQLAPVVYDIKCKILNLSTSDLAQVNQHVAWIISRYNQAADTVAHLLEQHVADQVSEVGMRVTEYLRLHQGHLALAQGVSEVAMSQQRRRGEEQVRKAAREAARAAHVFVQEQQQHSQHSQHKDVAGGGLMGLEAMFQPHPQTADSLMAEVFGSSSRAAAAAFGLEMATLSQSTSPPTHHPLTTSALASMATSAGAGASVQRDQSPFFINGIFDVFGSTAKAELPPVPANVFASGSDMGVGVAALDVWNPLAAATGQLSAMSSTGPPAAPSAGCSFQHPMGGAYVPATTAAAAAAAASMTHSQHSSYAPVSANVGASGVGMWPTVGNAVAHQTGSQPHQQEQQQQLGGIAGLDLDPILWTPGTSGDGLS